MSRRQRQPSRRAFTLVEMVVAMAILLLVALIIGTASSTIYNGWNRSERITRQLMDYQAIDQVMDLNVRNMIPFRWQDDSLENRFVFAGENDSLHFTTLRRCYDGDDGALLFVRLKLEDDALVAEYSPYPRLPWLEDGEQKYSREVLTGQVKSVAFLYAEQGSGDEIEWLDAWEEEDHEAIPMAIQLTIEWQDGRKECWLRRTAGSSTHSVFGYRQTAQTITGAGN